MNYECFFNKNKNKILKLSAYLQIKSNKSIAQIDSFVDLYAREMYVRRKSSMCTTIIFNSKLQKPFVGF